MKLKATFVDKTQVDRTRRYLQKQREAGLRRVVVMCPVDRVEELKSLVAQWRKDAKS